MSTSRLSWSLAAVCLLPLVGCEEIDPFLPSVSFDRLDVQSVSFEAVEADFVFVVDNPNPVDINLARFDYALAFEEVEFLVGDDPDGLELGAVAESEVALPVGFTFESLFELVDATRGEDVIDFDLTGSFGFNTPAGQVNLPYAADGDFPALRTPTFSFDTVRVDDLSWSGATLAIDLGVDNDHGSNLIFENFEYGIDLEGSELASGLVDDLGTVEGASTGTLTLPIDVSFADAGTGVYDVISGGGEVDLGLSASTDVDTPFGLVPLTIDETGAVSID